MQPKSTHRWQNSPLQKWHEEVTHHLLSILHKERGRRTVVQVVELIYVDQTRAPWPGSYLSPAKKLVFRKWLEKNAQVLTFMKEDSALTEFASRAASRLLRELSASQIASTLMNDQAEQKAQIEHMIRQELLTGASTEDTVSRGVQRYLREHSRSKRFQTEIRTPENDPLRELLGLPRIGKNILPKEDIRVHMARFITRSKLPLAFASTAQAQESFLGEFASQCQFAGFADKKNTILLLDVASALVAQELSFSKTAILKRCRKSPELAHLVDVKFRVKPTR